MQNPGPPGIDNGAYGIKKLLLDTQVKILHSEVNLIYNKQFVEFQ